MPVTYFVTGNVEGCDEDPRTHDDALVCLQASSMTKKIVGMPVWAGPSMKRHMGQRTQVGCRRAPVSVLSRSARKSVYSNCFFSGRFEAAVEHDGGFGESRHRMAFRSPLLGPLERRLKLGLVLARLGQDGPSDPRRRRRARQALRAAGKVSWLPFDAAVNCRCFQGCREADLCFRHADVPSIRQSRRGK